MLSGTGPQAKEPCHDSLSPPIRLGSPTNLTFGNGYIGGTWPSEPHYTSGGGDGYPGYYFNGQIADITYNK